MSRSCNFLSSMKKCVVIFFAISFHDKNVSSDITNTFDISILRSVTLLVPGTVVSGRILAKTGGTDAARRLMYQRSLDRKTAAQIKQEKQLMQKHSPDLFIRTDETTGLDYYKLVQGEDLFKGLAAQYPMSKECDYFKGREDEKVIYFAEDRNTAKRYAANYFCDYKLRSEVKLFQLTHDNLRQLFSVEFMTRHDLYDNFSEEYIAETKEAVQVVTGFDMTLGEQAAAAFRLLKDDTVLKTWTEYIEIDFLSRSSNASDFRSLPITGTTYYTIDFFHYVSTGRPGINADSPAKRASGLQLDKYAFSRLSNILLRLGFDGYNAPVLAAYDLTTDDRSPSNGGMNAVQKKFLQVEDGCGKFHAEVAIFQQAAESKVDVFNQLRLNRGGQRVEVNGLTSAAGKTLNGKTGTIVNVKDRRSAEVQQFLEEYWKNGNDSAELRFVVGFDQGADESGQQLPAVKLKNLRVIEDE